VGIVLDVGVNNYYLLQFRCQRVQGLRVGNTEIPNDKKLEVALQYIHGIGCKRAHQILCELSLVNKPTKDLTGIELNSLREEVSKYLTGPDLVNFLPALFSLSSNSCDSICQKSSFLTYSILNLLGTTC